MAKPDRVLLSAFIGSENLGDEAIFQALINQLAKKLEARTLTVSSVDPARTTNLLLRQHNSQLAEVAVAHRLWLLLTILRHDVCIFGGGGIIQDQSSILNLIYFLLQIQYAKLVRKKVILGFVGIGPIRSKVGRAWARRALSNIGLCIVRDQASQELLDDLKVVRTKTICASDIALNQRCLSGTTNRAISDDYVLLSLRHWYTQSRSVTVASLKSGAVEPGSRLDVFLSELAKELMIFLDANKNVSVLAVPCFGQRDNLVHTALLAKLGPRYQSRFRIHPPVSDPSQYMHLAGSANCVIAMRLHALVLASLQAVPLVALSYSPKVAAFMQQLGLADQVIDIESEGGLEEVAYLIEQALSNSTKIRDSIRQKVDGLRSLNCAALSTLVKLVKKE